MRCDNSLRTICGIGLCPLESIVFIGNFSKSSIIGGNYDRRMTGLAVGPFFGLKKVPQPALPYSTSGD